MTNSPFVQNLIEHGLIEEEHIAALRQSKNTDFDVACGLFSALEMNADRIKLAYLYGNSIGKAYVSLDKTLYEPEALALIKPEMARRLQCIPIYVLGGVLTAAMAHPEDPDAVMMAEKLVGHSVSAVFAFPHEIQNHIDIQYKNRDGLEKLSAQLSTDIEMSEEMNETRLKELSTSSGVIELVRGMLLYCVKYNASDIHIQPTAKTLDVRFRVDGRLRTLLSLSKTLMAPVISHLKIVSGGDIAEKRRPQDGRVTLQLKDRSYDFRLSTTPTIFGEKAVLRAIGSIDQSVKSLEELGLSKRIRHAVDELIKRPNGVLFVTGPTGSGKTTTLYSVLTRLQHPEVNIVTVEDPVELRIDGITQLQVNSVIGLDFAVLLRSVLRQDPEILLIGEIRDAETAKITSQAALTGHLVMSTLHTNNALQALTRLIEIGVDPFLLAPSVIGVMAQRLVRRICEHCKEQYEPSQEILDSIFYNRDDSKIYFYRGKGCDRCGQTGYSGRIAIHEVFILTDEIREMIASRASIIKIENQAILEGFRNMRYDGILKAMLGLTTIEEVDRVTVGLGPV